MSSERVSPGLSALEASYEIIREIGRGETSVVYLARDRERNDEVAIKLIRSKYLGDEETIGRFAREARFLERLVHPNIVRVRAILELGDAGLAIVMAYVPGRTLKDLIRRDGRLTPERAARFTREIAIALGTAHAVGIVHRDVKPENVFVDLNDRPLLADFGLARSMISDSQLTMAGVAIGTPAYMAPEQIEGASLDARGDVYSLGLVAWEMLTGHRPWEGESLYAVLYHQRYERLPDVRDLRDDVPGPLGDAIAVAIEKDPGMRWQNTAQMIDALDGLAPLQRTTTRPPPLSADTMRFARPSLGGAHIDGPVVPAQPHHSGPTALPFVEPGPASIPSEGAAHERSFISSAALESLAAELEARDKELASKTRRRYVLALGGVAALVALVALVPLVTNMQGHSSEVRPAPTSVPPGFVVRDSAGGSLHATQTAVSPSTQVPVTQQSVGQLADTAASRDNAKTDAKTDSGAAENDSKKSITTPEKAANKPAPAKPAPDKAAPDKAAPDKAAPDKLAPNKPTSAPVPVFVPLVRPSLSRVTVAAGGMHSCMLNADGHAYCWGGNDRGQLGAGGASSVATPLAVAGDLRFASIATGLSHNCAISRAGGAWCWGENEHGQLGDRSTMAHQAPIRIADARVFTAIGVGAAHSCALDSQGAALCWGSNAHGQLGSESLPGEIGAPTFVSGDHHYSSIALGWNFTCALDVGHAFCWGENANGQLGDGSIADRRVPVPVANGLTFQSIATGATHACGVTPLGEAYCWGNNSGGQLGDGTRMRREVPTAVKTSLRFVAIAAGALHTCALTADGEAFCWGRDNYGQLGDGGTAQDSAEPVRVVGNHTFATVRAFGSHTCATTSSGEAFCWGYNLDGQLGDGSRVNRPRPVYVEPPPGT